MTKRLIELDSLRGIASISVVLYHYSSILSDRYNIIVPIRFDYGYYGVNLFFMISGFVIFMAATKSSSISDFVVARISKLYPCYWAAVSITALVIFIFPLPDHGVSFFDYLLNLTMLEYWLRVPYVDGVYWSLRVEISFYVIIVVTSLIFKLNKIHSLACFWLITAVIVEFCIQYGLSGQLLFKVLKSILILDFATTFIIGIMLYHCWTRKMLAKSAILIILSLLVSYFINNEIEFIFNCIFTGILLLVVFNKGIGLKNKKLLFLGSISYPLYLIHQNIGYVLIIEMTDMFPNVHVYIPIVISIFFSIYLAYLLTCYFENLCSIFIKKSLKHYVIYLKTKKAVRF